MSQINVCHYKKDTHSLGIHRIPAEEATLVCISVNTSSVANNAHIVFPVVQRTERLLQFIAIKSKFREHVECNNRAARITQ